MIVLWATDRAYSKFNHTDFTEYRGCGSSFLESWVNLKTYDHLYTNLRKVNSAFVYGTLNRFYPYNWRFNLI